jgi:hypothetical protein
MTTASSRTQVRYAVANWIATAGITNLNQVFASHPKRINFEQNAPVGSPCRVAGVVFISREQEDRIAVGGAYDGWKRVDFDVQFQMYAHNMHNYSQDAMDDFDLVVDAVKARLRSGGHRLGMEDGDVIWQAAEPDITSEFGEPLTNDGGATEIWATLNFTVTQMIRS